jgi:hypothetical protein
LIALHSTESNSATAFMRVGRLDLIHTKYEPKGVLPIGDDDGAWVEVPVQDLRALRRAILDLDEFQRDGAIVRSEKSAIAPVSAD